MVFACIKTEILTLICILLSLHASCPICVKLALPYGTCLGFDKHFVFQSQVTRRRREDRLWPDEDFFAARHRAAHVVFADERGNWDGGRGLRLGF